MPSRTERKSLSPVLRLLLSFESRFELSVQTLHYTVRDTAGLENFTIEKVHEYVFSTIVDSFHELNIHDWVV